MWKESFAFICAVLFSMPVFTQSTIPADLQTQYERYSSQNLQEKLFVHTDKTFYLPGETIWFKVYDIDAASNKPIDLNKVAYVEILSGDLKPVLQTKIGLKESIGNGSLIINSSIGSGNYILRAYTSWMKNFGPDLYFEKLITIVNTLKNRERIPEDTSVDYDVQFFPEGGNLVYGIESKIGFRVAGRNGRGLNSRGTLIDQNNDTVAKFQSLHFGLGQFSFTPKTGNTYKAILQLDDGKITTTVLPVIYDKGYVMNVTNTDSGHIKITVNTNISSVEQYTYLLVVSRQKVKTAIMKEIRDGKAEFVIDKATLDEGISQFTIFSTARQPVCERLYFKRPEQKLTIDLKTDQSEYSARKKVNVKVISRNQSDQGIKTDMSMSVYLVDSLQTEEPDDIATYLWLTSDLKGTIESPGYYLKNTGIKVDEAIDNLMLTHGWRKFNWNDVLLNKKPAFEFIPEYSGHIITGKITDKRTDLPAKGIIAYVSVPGKRFRFNSSISDQNGRIKFDVDNFYGASDIIVQTNNQKDSLYRIDILSPFSDKYSTTRIPIFGLQQEWQNQLLSHMMSTQLQTAYSSASPQRFFLPVADTTAFYGKGDKTYYLDDYTRFITMEEVMREYVMEVSVRRSGGKFHYRVNNTPYKVFFENDPLILLDGVPVFNIDKIMAFDPLKVQRMDIVARKYYSGNFAYNGIVSYVTYEGDLGGYQLDPGSLIIEYQGLQLQRQFFSPVYETPQQSESRVPDLRNVLFWSPDIQTDKTGEQVLSFYTSDLPGKYVAVIQGITANGLPGSAVTGFTVKK